MHMYLLCKPTATIILSAPTTVDYELLVKFTKVAGTCENYYDYCLWGFSFDFRISTCSNVDVFHMVLSY